MADLAVAAIPQELNFEPVTSIPPGYTTVQYKVPSYNNIPAPTSEGTEIQLNIPHTENTFIDPTTTYLDVAVEIECEYRLPEIVDGRMPGLKNPGDFIEGICLNYFRGSAWSMFKRYQVYANNAILIEDVDEVGILTTMMNSLSKSNATVISGSAYGEDEDDFAPGAKFGFCYILAVPLFNRMPVFNAETGKIVAPINAWTIDEANGNITRAPLPLNSNISPQLRSRAMELEEVQRLKYGGLNSNGAIIFKEGEVPTLATPLVAQPFVYVNGANRALKQPAAMTQLGGAISVFPNDGINDSEHQTQFVLANTNAGVITTHYPVVRDGANCRLLDRYSSVATQNRRYRAGVTDAVVIVSEEDDAVAIPSAAYINQAPRTLRHTVRFSLPLFGLLGANNPKLYPAFAGPTQIRLTTESVTKFLHLGAGMDASTLRFTIREVNFCCNQLVLANDALRAVLQRLPMQGLIPIRCNTFAHSSELLPPNSQGLQQLLVASRRSSMKALFIAYERSQNQDTIVEGKYASIHPNVGGQTHLFVNNTMYPRHGINMVRNPADAYQQLLITLNHTQSSLMRPNIKFSEFQASDSHYFTNNYRYRGVVPDRGGICGFVAGADNAAVALLQGINDDISQGFAVHNFEDYVNTSYAQYKRLQRNKAYTVIDTEHYAKRDFLSGISTLTGNTFYNLQIDAPIVSGYVVHFFNFHDAIVAFDVMNKNVTIKL